MSYTISHGKYYYDLQNTIMKLKKECFICGCKQDLEPHHIRKVKQNNKQYSEENNVVMLCHKHHKRYHNHYKKVNSKTFAEYVKKQTLKEVNEKNKKIQELESENRILKKENNKLKQQLDFII